MAKINELFKLISWLSLYISYCFTSSNFDKPKRMLQSEMLDRSSNNKVVEHYQNDSASEYRIFSSKIKKMPSKMRYRHLISLLERIKQDALKKPKMIKRVTVGKNVRELFKTANISPNITQYINSESTLVNLPLLQKKQEYIKEKKRERKLRDTWDNSNRTTLTHRKRALVGPNVSEMTGSKEENPSFSYLPGLGGPFAGMPPLMMNPVHFHPDTTVSLNRTDSTEHNFHSAQEYRMLKMREQATDLSDIDLGLSSLEGLVDMIHNRIKDRIGDNIEKLGLIERNNRSIRY